MALLDGDNQSPCATCLLAKQCCAISDVDRSEEGLAERPTASFVLGRQGHPATREDDLPVSLSATVDGTADFVTTYEYDAEDRVVGIRQTDQDGAEVADKYVTLTYTDDGSLEQIVRYESLDTSEMVAVSEYSYDEYGRLSSLVHYQDADDPLAEYTWTYEGGGTVEVVSDEESNALAGFSSGLDTLLTSSTETEVNDLADYVWTFDSAFTGLMTQMTTSDGVVEYSYDARGQLTGATYDYQDDESYSYDANGNRTGDGYVVGDYNRLLSDGTYDYEYDAEGNRIKRTTIATGEVTEYVWDNRNRLVEVVDRLSDGGPIVQSVEYVYDSQNRWIGKSVDSDGDGPQEAVDTYFVYDDDQIILQIDGEGEVTNRYLWGPAVDQILAAEQVQEDGSTEVLWTLTDHLNTVRDLADYDPDTTVTTVVNHIVYDAYGQVTGQTGSTVTTLFGFTARPFDADTGLQNNLNRWYDAATGTWISEDPSGFAAGDANLYRYVGNEVTQLVDPTGLAWWNLWLCDLGETHGEEMGSGFSAVFNNSFEVDLEIARVRQESAVAAMADGKSNMTAQQFAGVRNGVLKNGLTEAEDLAARTAKGAEATVETGIIVGSIIYGGVGVYKAVGQAGLGEAAVFEGSEAVNLGNFGGDGASVLQSSGARAASGELMQGANLAETAAGLESKIQTAGTLVDDILAVETVTPEFAGAAEAAASELGPAVGFWEAQLAEVLEALAPFLN